MQPASKDICTLLEADSGLGLVFATNLFVGREPATPDDCVTVFDIPGDAPELTLEGNVGPVLYAPSVQVRVRNNAYMTGWDLIHNIQKYLHGKHNLTQGDTTYLLIRSVDEPMLLDWDDNDRARFVATFAMYRR